MEKIFVIKQVNCRLSSHLNEARRNIIMDKVIPQLSLSWCIRIILEKRLDWSGKKVEFVMASFVQIGIRKTLKASMPLTMRDELYKTLYSRTERRFEPFDVGTSAINMFTFQLTDEDVAILFHESPGLPLMYMWTHCPQNVLYRLPLDLMHMIADFI